MPRASGFKGLSMPVGFSTQPLWEGAADVSPCLISSLFL